MFKILVLSDLHIHNNDTLINNDTPLNFYLNYTSIKNILETENPDLTIINGDIIEDVNKLNVQTNVFIINLLSLITNKSKLIINTGNHDVIETSNDGNPLNNYINSFKNMKNISIVSNRLKTYDLLENLSIHVMPYKKDCNILYKQVEQKMINEPNYHIVFGHNDLDYINTKLNIPVNNDSDNIFKIKKLTKFSKSRLFDLFWGHYHERYEDNYIKVISSLMPHNYGNEKSIKENTNIKNLYHYLDEQFRHGYYVIQYDGTNKNVKFKQNRISKRYLRLDEKYLINDEYFTQLNSYVNDNENFYFYLRYYTSLNNVSKIKELLKTLSNNQNIIQQQIILKSDNSSNQIQNSKHDKNEKELNKDTIIELLSGELDKFSLDKNIKKIQNKYLTKLKKRI